MSVFDTLAERRCEEWLEKVSASDYQPPAPVKDTAIRKSYDKAAHASTAEKRDELLEKARQLEFQLVLLLEKRKMPLVAATLRSSLLVHRERVMSSEREQGF